MNLERKKIPTTGSESVEGIETLFPNSVLGTSLLNTLPGANRTYSVLAGPNPATVMLYAYM